MLKGDYLRESLSYVLRIQGVQERIKFEFVEPLLSNYKLLYNWIEYTYKPLVFNVLLVLGFMQGWLVFYHSGHEIAEDAKDYISDLMYKVQKTRNNFEETHAKAEELKAKYMDSKMVSVLLIVMTYAYGKLLNGFCCKKWKKKKNLSQNRDDVPTIFVK